MSSARLLRPLARSLQQRQPLLAQSIVRSSPAVRPAAIATFTTKRNVAPFTPSINAQVQKLGQIRKEGRQQTTGQSQESELNTSVILKAAMPQLVPFYFMNEVTVAFICLPTLIYLFSKYVLPKTVRTRAARLFISKL
ncbi:hypothetical protein NA57DRAFT_77275 [Rhizodiscina lignyota]|uniref:ATP synthase protein 8 n=1 Tax=Rhizodiscina lignyota TaxID=1504668 RepID=A0A9P4IDI5_9PEZI|nr:hypothetical protein NA57DRAFT_77275 [Rhizodiscina lignyota]